MTHIGGVGRSKALEDKIVRAIRASRSLHLTALDIKLIFGDLLEDHVISEKLRSETTDKH